MNSEPRNFAQQDLLDRLASEEDGTIYYHPGSITAGEVPDMARRGLVRSGQDAGGYLWVRLTDSDEADDPQ